MNPVQKRFLRGLAAAIAGALVSYAVGELVSTPDIFGPLTPLVTAALLAADKYLRDQRP